MSTANPSQFPSQKKTISQKTEKWIKECIDAAEQIAIYRNDKMRMDYKNKRANYLLMMNKVDPADIQRITNPYGLGAKEFPANMQNYPIVVPRINVLVGEEIKRKFDWKIKSTNRSSVNSKQEEIRSKLDELLYKFIKNKSLSKEQFDEEVKKLDKWRKYSFKDIREIEATNIMRYFYETLQLQRKV